MNISVVIITKDEEANIAKCIIAARKVSSDVVVIDAFSTDKTVSIAEGLDCRVIRREWIGYGYNKNLGAQHAKFEWILSLDADEVLDDELIKEIKNINYNTEKVYAFNRLTYIGNQWVQYSGWYPQYVKRIFNKNYVKWDDRDVHEQLDIPKDFQVKRLHGKCHHYSFKDKGDYLQRQLRYAQLRVILWQTKSPPSIFKLYLGPLLKFITIYFFKRGFLDGRVGYLIASTEAKMMRYSINQYSK